MNIQLLLSRDVPELPAQAFNEWGPNAQQNWAHLNSNFQGGKAMLTVRELDGAIKKAAKTETAIKLTDTDRRGQGSLQLRISAAGKANFYYRHITSDGKRDDFPLGGYDPAGTKGLTLERARDRYGELASIYRSGVKDIRAHLQAQEKIAAEALRGQQEAQAHREAGSLGALLTAYVEYLQAKGKPSAKDVENTIKNHVTQLSELVATRANEIGPTDLRLIFDRMQDRGLTRSLGKTRAALHSAYNFAARSEFDSTIPVIFRAFKISTNPVAPLPTFAHLSKPGERTLSHAELRQLLQELASRDTMIAKALLTMIYLGGQRPTQLVRATLQDVDLDRGLLMLHDGKGKRTHPRLHVLPLLAPVRGWIEDCLSINSSAPSIFSSDGMTIPYTGTLSKLVHTISGGSYRMGDIRRTCETELAGLGVSKDLRAQILSHGLGGIQAKHYDRHQYLEEKTEALNHWIAYLEGLMAGNVIPLRGVGA